MTSYIHVKQGTIHNIDILKYLMSVMIIMIHVGYSFQFPILRLAVPVFFVISSYLFFHKIKDLNKAERCSVYHKFVIRAIKLYAFWFVVLLPVTIVVRRWYAMDVLEFIKTFPLTLLFDSTFQASWYIPAYIIGISIAYYLGKHNVVLFIAGILLYIQCCFASNYNYVFDTELIKWGGVTSFPAGVYFIAVGKLLTEKNYKSISIGIIGAVIGILGLYIENHIVIINEWRRCDDCYFSLMLLAPSLVLLAISIKDSIQVSTAYLRKMSTIYYCTHYALITIIPIVFRGIEKFSLFLCTLLLCTLISIALIKLSQYKRLNWLKYSY